MKKLWWPVLALLYLLPLVVESRYYLNILIFTCINVILASGLSLLFGFGGQISLGHAQFFGLGAYTSAILTTRLGMPFVPALACAATVPAVVAYAVGRPVLRLKGYYLAMATVALSGILDVLFREQGWLTGGFDGISGISAPALGPLRISGPRGFYLLALTVAVLVLLFSFSMLNSRVGRALRALKESDLAASVMGINVARYKVQIFALSGLFAGIAGSLYAHYVSFISPETFSLHASVTLILILAIGGLSSLWGAVLGAVLLTVLPQVLRSFKTYDNLAYGLVVILIMVKVPGGLWGLCERLYQRWSRRHQEREGGDPNADGSGTAQGFRWLGGGGRRQL